jgi:signal transduction histidine kinase
VDIDERRRAQEAQRAHDEEQLALARNFERWILAIVSHDIRDPLSAITLSAHQLNIVAEPGGAATKYAQIITRGAQRIQNIVSDLLDLSLERDGSGIPIAPAPTDLRKTCRQIIAELETIATNRKITFDCDVDGDGSWDEPRIGQAISNLASNALQHGTPGSPVRVRLTGDDQRIAVEVSNQGTIPSELLPRIFEPFRSGRQHTRRGGGLGLGLFIANAIARAHGGGLEVDSAEGTTRFRLILPRRSPSPSAIAPA